MNIKDEEIPAFYDLISPRQAKLWLSRNPNNRRLREELVAEYVIKMRNREWGERGGMPVMITADGELINGQHRLTALLRLGHPMILRIQICDRPKRRLKNDN